MIVIDCERSTESLCLYQSPYPDPSVILVSTSLNQFFSVDTIIENCCHVALLCRFNVG